MRIKMDVARETHQDRKLARMRAVALGALIFCFCGLIFSRLYEGSHPFFPWMRAFCEAATIGALADWFAVVALFRHPLGIPIPHTAILPLNKYRVAETLARFIETNFLTLERINNRLDQVNFADVTARWLRENNRQVVQKTLQFAPGIISGVNDREAAAILAQQARVALRGISLSQTAGAVIETFLQGGRDRELFTAAILIADNLVIENRENIKEKIREEIPLNKNMLGDIPFLGEFAGPMLQQIGDSIAEMVADKTIEKVQRILGDAGAHPEHALWLGFRKHIEQIVSDLKNSAEMAARVDAVRDALLTGSLVDDFAMKGWQALRRFVVNDCATPDSEIARRIESALAHVANQLENEAAVRDGLNTFLRTHLASAILSAKPHVTELVVSTVASWDGNEMSLKLENAVGSDLQFIRLNGTFIGGLIGVFIHLFFLFLLH